MLENAGAVLVTRPLLRTGVDAAGDYFTEEMMDAMVGEVQTRLNEGEIIKSWEGLCPGEGFLQGILRKVERVPRGIDATVEIFPALEAGRRACELLDNEAGQGEPVAVGLSGRIQESVLVDRDGCTIRRIDKAELLDVGVMLESQKVR